MLMLTSINKNVIIFGILSLLVLSLSFLKMPLAGAAQTAALPANVIAKNTDFTDCTEENLNENNCGIVRYLKIFINILSAAAGIFIVIMIAFAGVQYTMSRDNPQATQAAKNRIMNALLALVAYLFMFAFLQWAVPGGIF